MNPIALVATLCLAYSVAGRRCLTDGELEYKLFQDLDPTYQELLKETYKKDFFERDLVLSYKVVAQDGDAGFDSDGANSLFPSVILSRSDRVRAYHLKSRIGNYGFTGFPSNETGDIVDVSA